jgi:hypothetical protein
MGLMLDQETRTTMSQAPTRTRRLRLGPRAAGMLLTPDEFDRADFKEGWRYELIKEVLIVSPSPSGLIPKSRDGMCVVG